MAGLGRRFLEKIPGGRILLLAYKKLKFNFYYPFFKGKEALFTQYYEQRIWGNEESYSGPGSTLSYTENLRSNLPRIIEEFQIKTMLDAPCGDFNWFREINHNLKVEYTGGDIVKALAVRNQAKFGDNATKFIHLDITKQALPKAELWMCRDCWIHFSNSDIKKALQRFLDSDIEYLFTTTHPDTKVNHNIATGEVRLLNLEASPFNFCKPIKHIDDWVEGHPIKIMALWKREMIEGRIREILA